MCSLTRKGEGKSTPSPMGHGHTTTPFPLPLYPVRILGAHTLCFFQVLKAVASHEGSSSLKHQAMGTAPLLTILTHLYYAHSFRDIFKLTDITILCLQIKHYFIFP